MQVLFVPLCVPVNNRNMDISINRKSFISAFGIGSTMAGKSKLMPALDKAKVVIKQNECVVSSYDGETAVRKRFDIIKSDEDGKFCVNPKDLLNILRSIKDEVLTMEVSETILTIRHNRGKVSIPVESADDYPQPKIENGGKEFVLDSEALFTMFNEAKMFRANDTIHPVLMGIQLYIGEGVFGVFATDSHSLYNDEHEHECKDAAVSAVFPPGSVEPILNIVNSTESIRVVIQERNVQVISDDAAVVLRVIEGKYPNARSVIPTNTRIEAIMDKEELSESVKRASLTSSMSSNIIKLSVEGMNMNIVSEDIDSSKNSSENVMCNSNGNITIGVNYNNVMNAMSVLGKEIHVCFVDPSRAMIWKDSEHVRKIVLIMPMMLQE